MCTMMRYTFFTVSHYSADQQVDMEQIHLKGRLKVDCTLVKIQDFKKSVFARVKRENNLFNTQ